MKQSKTDQERKGIKIIIGKTDDDLCPVAALLIYLNVKGLRPGPLFVWKAAIYLTSSIYIYNLCICIQGIATCVDYLILCVMAYLLAMNFTHAYLGCCKVNAPLMWLGGVS